MGARGRTSFLPVAVPTPQSNIEVSPGEIGNRAPEQVSNAGEKSATPRGRGRRAGRERKSVLRIDGLGLGLVSRKGAKTQRKDGCLKCGVGPSLPPPEHNKDGDSETSACAALLGVFAPLRETLPTARHPSARPIRRSRRAGHSSCVSSALRLNRWFQSLLSFCPPFFCRHPGAKHNRKCSLATSSIDRYSPQVELDPFFTRLIAQTILFGQIVFGAFVELDHLTSPVNIRGGDLDHDVGDADQCPWFKPEMLQRIPSHSRTFFTNSARVKSLSV